MKVKVKVTSPSFSKSSILVEELKSVLRGIDHELIINSAQIKFESNELIKYLEDADIAVVGLEVINKDVLSKLTKLKMISKYGVGTDNIDLEECQKRQITFGWTPGVNRRSVSEMTLGFMLSLCRNLALTNIKLKSGVWHKDGGYQLTGKTVGIIGLGNIGQDLVRLLQPFECKIQYCDIEEKKNFSSQFGLTKVSFDEIFSTSDIVSVHVPFTEKTNHFINYSMLKKMKPGSIFINTSRGNVIIQEDLKRVLLENHLAGAAIDVYDIEPPVDMELISISNLINTPHIGGNSKEAVLSMGRSAIEHVRKYLHHE